jgi:hypothetical protein
VGRGSRWLHCGVALRVAFPGRSSRHSLPPKLGRTDNRSQKNDERQHACPDKLVYLEGWSPHVIRTRASPALLCPWRTSAKFLLFPGGLAFKGFLESRRYSSVRRAVSAVPGDAEANDRPTTTATSVRGPDEPIAARRRLLRLR